MLLHFFFFFVVTTLPLWNDALPSLVGVVSGTSTNLALLLAMNEDSGNAAKGSFAGLLCELTLMNAELGRGKRDPVPYTCNKLIDYALFFGGCN